MGKKRHSARCIHKMQLILSVIVYSDLDQWHRWEILTSMLCWQASYTDSSCLCGRDWSRCSAGRPRILTTVPSVGETGLGALLAGLVLKVAQRGIRCVVAAAHLATKALKLTARLYSRQLKVHALDIIF